MTEADLFWTLLTAPLGPFVGSFVGLLSLRIPRGERLIGRSMCRDCGRKLGPFELLPLLSYFALRRKCRNCGAAIPKRYPLIELACLGIGIWSAFAFGGPLTLVTAAFGWCLLLIAIVDAEHFLLPDSLTLPLLAGGLAVAAFASPPPLAERAIGAVAGFASLALAAFLYRAIRKRQGLGGGDPRLFAAIGAWTGWAGLPTVIVWASIGALIFVGVLALRGQRTLWSDRLPFGAFLALGAWLTWLYGPFGFAVR